jgi:hypothetical protein
MVYHYNLRNNIIVGYLFFLNDEEKNSRWCYNKQQTNK